MTQSIKTQTNLLAEFPDNSMGAITAEDSRDLVVSSVHVLPEGDEGENVIIPNATGVVPLTIQAKSGQTAHLLNIENSSASVIAGVNAAGQWLGDGSQLTGIAPPIPLKTSADPSTIIENASSDALISTDSDGNILMQNTAGGHIFAVDAYGQPMLLPSAPGYDAAVIGFDTNGEPQILGVNGDQMFGVDNSVARPIINGDVWPGDAAGALTNDGSGNLSWSASLSLPISLPAVDPVFQVDTGGNITTASLTTTTSPAIALIGSDSSQAYLFNNGASVLGVDSGLAVSGNLSATGTTRLDNGDITTNGSGQLTAVSFVGGGSGLTSLDGSNISSGTVSAARLPTVGVGYGGTGTATQFTAGSIVFAGASGVYSQDNTNLNWNDATYTLTVGSASASNPSIKLLNGTSTYYASLGLASTSDTLTLTNQTIKVGVSSSFVVTGSGFLYAANASNLNITTAITLSAWIKPTSLSGNQQVICKGAGVGSGNAYGLGIYGTGASATLGAIGPYVYGTLTANVWQHIAMTYDNTTLKMYLNGSFVTSYAAASAITSNTSPLTIGGAVSGTDEFLGKIKDAKIYNAALSAGNIATLAAGGSGSDALTTNLVSWFKGNDLTDSEDSNPLTISGTVTYSTDVPSSNPGSAPAVMVTSAVISSQDGVTNQGESCIVTVGDVSGRTIINYGALTFFAVQQNGTIVFELNSSGQAVFTNPVAWATPITWYGTAIGYTVTTSSAEITGATVTLTNAKAWKLTGQLQLELVGAILTGQTVTVVLYDTTSAANVANATVTVTLPTDASATTQTLARFDLPPVVFTPSGAADTIQMRAVISGSVSSGSVQISAANIMATNEY